MVRKVEGDFPVRFPFKQNRAPSKRQTHEGFTITALTQNQPLMAINRNRFWALTARQLQGPNQSNKAQIAGTRNNYHVLTELLVALKGSLCKNDFGYCLFGPPTQNKENTLLPDIHIYIYVYLEEVGFLLFPFRAVQQVVGFTPKRRGLTTRPAL